MLKLILADNQAIFRAGIAKVLAVEDEMRIVAQAQTQEQMFMALDKFRAAVLVVAAGFHNDFAAIVLAANKAKTRVVVLADTGESAQRHMTNGAHGVVYRNVTSAALVDCVRKVSPRSWEPPNKSLRIICAMYMTRSAFQIVWSWRCSPFITGF